MPFASRGGRGSSESAPPPAEERRSARELAQPRSSLFLFLSCAVVLNALVKLFGELREHKV